MNVAYSKRDSDFAIRFLVSFSILGEHRMSSRMDWLKRVMIEISLMWTIVMER